MRLLGRRCLLFLGFLVLFQSCISYESLVNYEQGKELPYDVSEKIRNTKDITIQANDVLSIKVHGQDIATAAPFNLTSADDNSLVADASLYQLQGYLVNQNGEIDFPILGTINVKGMTMGSIKELLLKRLENHLKSPVVNVRIINFKVTVSGEVNEPNSFQIYNDRITLSEVITMAGDLTPYADRTNILVVREKDGMRSYGKVDMSASDFFTSKYYYLHQNDFIYVKPLEAKRGAVADNSNKILPFVSAIVSIAALLISAFK